MNIASLDLTAEEKTAILAATFDIRTSEQVEVEVEIHPDLCLDDEVVVVRRRVNPFVQGFEHVYRTQELG